MRKIVTLVMSMLFLFATAFAQTKEVTGRVTDASGAPLPGVSVLVKGTKTGTTSDASGNFSIQVKEGAVLVISGAGYQATEVKATPGTAMKIQLTVKKEELTEVVVTALGIRREKKALGYAVATVDKKALELRPDGDVVRLLNGKAPGVDIGATSGISGSGTNIVIRGVNTISGSSQPLFIVDGVPFDASTNAQSSFVYGNTTTSRFLDLDPNNIENVSILKGLSATTLYGELGRNGVVVITTKNGTNRKINKKAEVTVLQSYFTNTVSNLPDYQYSYGGGFDQSLGLAFFSNWGARFQSTPVKVAHPYDRAALQGVFPEFQQVPGNGNDLIYEYKPYYNSVKKFFRTGHVKTTSVNVAASGQNVNFNANYSYMDDQGFTPGNSVYKNTFGMGGTAKLSNNITLSGTFNYASTDFKSPPTSTSFGSNPSVSSVFGNLIYTPIAVNLMGTPADGANYLPWENPVDKSSIYYRGGNDIQNPIWTVNNSFTGQKINRVYGNLQARYEVKKGLALSYRVGYDTYSDYNFLSQNKGGTVGGSDWTLGLHRTANGYNTIWDHAFLADYLTDLNSNWNLNVNAGINSQERIYSQNGQRSTQQLVYGLFDHDNYINHLNTSEGGGGLDFKTRTQSIGVFAQGTFGFKEYLYFTVGGRNSWTSNLEKANRSIFYPSGSVSFVPTSAIAALQNNKIVNYLKLRAGYATSANFGSPYNTRNVLNISTNVFQDRVGTVLNSNTISDRLANPNLKPELLAEVEVGAEAKFINNRLSLDFTYYNRVSKDQILDRELDPSTGFTVTSINAGSVRNQGIEIALGYTAVRTKDWNWQVDFNFTRNRNKVFDLPTDIKQIGIAGFSNEGLFVLEGQPLGVIMASSTVKDSKTGQRIVNSNGDYVSNNTLTIIGNPNPDYKLTGISTLTYKAFSFRMQWDYTKGGDMLAYTPGTLLGRGLTKDTDFDRYLPLILPGVKADGTPNDKQISASQAYFNNWSGFFGMQDLITYDATIIRLREASFSYNLPTSYLAKTPFGSASLTISGQNLWYLAPYFPKYTNFDPEVNSLGVSNGRGYETLAGPTSRRIGASIRVTF
ncbi:MAG: SusC/RagA family TonB-linked outer membrane protein [Chitinophagaceae bacterium]|nr:SusC/RagA family TonB-linked outer membrane protein [Chitinophagaceae bacterium]